MLCCGSIPSTIQAGALAKIFTAVRAQVHIIRQLHNAGPAAARNAGLHAAREAGIDIVCFLDDDCVPAPQWVEQMIDAQLQCPGIVGGLTCSTKPDSLEGKSSRLVSTSCPSMRALNTLWQ